METFLLISAIIITLTVLLAIHRFNHNMARFMPSDTRVYPNGQPLYLINTAGKWLTLLGGLATAPLIVALIFSPEGSPHWVISTGVNGFILLALAILTLGFVLLKQAFKHKGTLKHLGISLLKRYLTPLKTLNPFKVMAWGVGIGLLMAFLPFFIELFSLLVYLAGFILAARFGLLDNVGDRDDLTEIDYIQEGIDYDFFHGTNEYNSFPDN